MSRNTYDFWAIVALLLSSAFAWASLDLKALWGLSLFTLLPTVYLVLRKKKNIKKLALGTAILGVAFGLLFDPVQVFNGAWHTNTVLPDTFLGLPIVLDNIIGYAVMALFMLTFYEHFLDDERRPATNPRWKKLALLCAGLLSVFVLVYFYHPQTLLISFSYFRLGFVAILIPIIFLIARPKLINKFALLTIFFFFVWLLAEYTALSLGNWGYGNRAQYVGWVTFFSVSFPIEELVLWMLCYAAVIVSFYEYFIDDGR